MTDNTNIEALLPCPFCGCAMHIKSNKDWHRPIGEHDEDCEIVEHDSFWPATPECLNMLISSWNRRCRAALSNAEPVGVAGTMPGAPKFTMVCFESYVVPAGSKLFLHPSVPGPLIDALKEARNIVAYAASGMTHSCHMTNFAKRTLEQVDAALTNTGEQG